jgi:flagellar biogenesis protein FliO
MGAAFTVTRVVVVLLLLAATLWGLRKYDSSRTKGARRSGRNTRLVEVLGQARLSRGASVALVRVGDTSFAVGVSEKAVTLLSERPLDVLPEDSPQSGGPSLETEPLASGKGTGRPSFGQALFAQVQQLRPSAAKKAAGAGVRDVLELDTATFDTLTFDAALATATADAAAVVDSAATAELLTTPGADTAAGSLVLPRTSRAPRAPRAPRASHPRVTDGTVARVSTPVETPRPTPGTRRLASRPARMPDAASLR